MKSIPLHYTASSSSFWRSPKTLNFNYIAPRRTPKVDFWLLSIVGVKVKKNTEHQLRGFFSQSFFRSVFCTIIRERGEVIAPVPEWDACQLLVACYFSVFSLLYFSQWYVRYD